MQIYLVWNSPASKMDAIREELEYEYLNGESDSFSRGYGHQNGYTESRSEYEDVSELKQNLRAAMKGARHRIAALRVDLEQK